MSLPTNISKKKSHVIISFLRVTALTKNTEYSNINGVFLESKVRNKMIYTYTEQEKMKVLETFMKDGKVK